jgi:hypothetical protein
VVTLGFALAVSVYGTGIDEGDETLALVAGPDGPTGRMEDWPLGSSCRLGRRSSMSCMEK